ncbi:MULTISPECIES: tetratricopeptide repeat protein [unclassified Streptomyces]|uniref:tetratricopeptide repeat protein n=1 Tax=unclassified Streptomyces TaxID=2593676 RepID=UPI002E810297|nr:tetratricopeptide repeat protein [Streptomyces sp. NBC_00589]WTI40572.1 sel1 repeat family protein [Streptomyces sp. NBC_00775]WUB25744.1 sel1 repeat family protein [Streptomyces sp. NBC_00589]
MSSESAPSTDVLGSAQRALAAAQWGDHDAKARLDELRGPLAALAEAGDLEARSLLGGVALEYDEDAVTALLHFTLAAEQGHPAGQRGLGHLLATGRGTQRDPQRAERLFTLAAEAGDSHAMFNLAMMHLMDTATDHMSPQAVMTLLMTAAEQDVPEAAGVLGEWFSELGREVDALTWYERAAEGGHGPSMFATAVRYRDAVGTDRDAVRSLTWFLMMLHVGNGDGIHESHQLVSDMSDQQIRDAARRAHSPEWAEALINSRHQ